MQETADKGGVVHLRMTLVTHIMLSFVRLAELHLVEGAFQADCAGAAGAVILKHAYEIDSAEGTQILLRLLDVF